MRILEAVPDDVVEWSRGWDFAGTEVTEANTDPDWTAGVKMGLRADGRYVIADAQHERLAAAEVRRLVLRVAGQDGRDCRISVPEDPGQAGKEQAQTYVAMLAGYPVFRRRATATRWPAPSRSPRSGRQGTSTSCAATGTSGTSASSRRSRTAATTTASTRARTLSPRCRRRGRRRSASRRGR